MYRRLFKNLFYCVICSILVSGIFCFIYLNGSSKTKAVADTGSSVSDSTHTDIKQDNSLRKKSKDNRSKCTDKKCLGIYNKNKDLLILANRDNPLPKDYSPSLRYICNGRLMASSHIYESLVQMLADAKLEGYSYWIASAYRSYEKQQSLVDEDVDTFISQGMTYENALNEVYKETMPAGCSEHQTGLALDILCSDNTNMDVSQTEEQGNKWLRDNCYKYGFILRYPESKSEITGVNFEPWHFRYVGKEAAKFIMKNHITLEEFYRKIGK